jgi:hypothetical protein
MLTMPAPRRRATDEPGAGSGVGTPALRVVRRDESGSGRAAG